MKDVNQVFLLL